MTEYIKSSVEPVEMKRSARKENSECSEGIRSAKSWLFREMFTETHQAMGLLAWSLGLGLGLILGFCWNLSYAPASSSPNILQAPHGHHPPHHLAHKHKVPIYGLLGFSLSSHDYFKEKNSKESE